MLKAGFSKLCPLARASFVKKCVNPYGIVCSTNVSKIIMTCLDMHIFLGLFVGCMHWCTRKLNCANSELATWHRRCIPVRHLLGVTNERAIGWTWTLSLNVQNCMGLLPIDFPGTQVTGPYQCNKFECNQSSCSRDLELSPCTCARSKLVPSDRLNPACAELCWGASKWLA